ncbi:PREDICTED: zinc-finger homeodomain [Prunus dulcis]|uniref:PREDICTED: zinc-finger homeodomain n=1 Tax=Prunus dulcis TaxID=3755 RepID=A0A5E4FFJ1_PRUDU|nr:zinc-finger homeodomain protein 4-like [Prunus dulcis]KAI5356430.1 hypothetical protein L3X38_009325 [Prunus dulcis]VVA26914.1 PREDICTED: zinc-finger homeodomain [Prunus dulcis]
MELSSQEAGEIPIPINSSYGGGHGHGHMIHHNHHHHDPAAAATVVPHNHSNLIPSSAVPQNQNPSNTNGSSMPTSLDHHHHHPHSHPHHEEEEHVNIVPYSCKKGGVRYKECLKNHAAAMGGTATDGCGEFMPSGEEGTIEALNCSACNCHRNFHRKEVEGEQQPFPSSWDHNFHHTINRVGVGSRKFLLGPGHHKNLIAAPQEGLGYHTMPSSRAAAPHQMIMSYNMGMGMGMGMGALPSESDEQEQHDGGGAVGRPAAAQLAKKRFRTKFTQEQKEKMFNFAEKVGWKIQKQEDSVVQNFCQEIGVKRRVLKVWMHNNKHNLAKKNTPPPPPPPPPA